MTTPEGQERLFVPRDYYRAVEKAGGIAVLVPMVSGAEAAALVLGRLDGVLLSGGADMDPRLYGEQPLPQLGAIDPERDTSELAYVGVALEQNLPLLAICRGHQVLAVAAGGSLYQDLPSQVPGAIKHSQQAPRWYASHGVRSVPGSQLERLLGSGEIGVNSYHHQAVKAVPPGFAVSATAADGVIEAIESTTHGFVVGVQWHPECFVTRTDTMDGLFAGLVAAASHTGARA